MKIPKDIIIKKGNYPRMLNGKPYVLKYAIYCTNKKEPIALFFTKKSALKIINSGRIQHIIGALKDFGFKKQI